MSWFKALKIRASIVFNISSLNNTIFSCFFFFFAVTGFLIPAVIAQIFIPIAELAMPAGTQTNEGNAEIETQPVTVQDKISKCYTYMFFYPFHSLNHYVLYLPKDR